VAGNVDSLHRLRRVFDGTAVRLLVNEIVAVEVRGCRFAIGGIESEFTHPAARATMARLSDDQVQADVRVLLTHAPDPVLDLPPTSRVDLIVAGHTHGGQVQIPGIGPIVTGSRVPRAMAAGGLSRADGTLVYVSRGVGCERGRAPRLRLFCPPEISLLTFVPRREVDHRSESCESPAEQSRDREGAEGRSNSTLPPFASILVTANFIPRLAAATGVTESIQPRYVVDGYARPPALTPVAASLIHQPHDVDTGAT
jgi:hypothetical protein